MTSIGDHDVVSRPLPRSRFTARVTIVTLRDNRPTTTLSPGPRRVLAKLA